LPWARFNVDDAIPISFLTGDYAPEEAYMFLESFRHPPVSPTAQSGSGCVRKRTPVLTNGHPHHRPFS
jgi:hypothetical protein